MRQRHSAIHLLRMTSVIVKVHVCVLVCVCVLCVCVTHRKDTHKHTQKVI